MKTLRRLRFRDLAKSCVVEITVLPPRMDPFQDRIPIDYANVVMDNSERLSP